jgi:hypothetical protein
MSEITNAIRRTRDGRGDFFAVDSATWKAALSLGINAAIALLVLARGSEADNCTTIWSVASVERHTGISRPKAQAAIGALTRAGALRVMAAEEITVRIDAGTLGRRPRKGCPAYHIGRTAAEEGAEVSTVVWLPNSLVDGVPSAPLPPLELIRQTQHIGALKLLIGLYGAHDLQNCRGVSFRAVRRTYARTKIAESRGYAVWKFEPGVEHALPSTSPSREFLTGQIAGNPPRDPGLDLFWDSLRVLRRRGLVEYVAHLVESDTEEGEIIAPVDRENGEPGECVVAWAAQGAAERLLGSAGEHIAERHGGILVPVFQHAEQVQVVGVLRLLHRPKNFNTAAWLGLAAEWAELAEKLTTIAADVDLEKWRASA